MVTGGHTFGAVCLLKLIAYTKPMTSFLDLPDDIAPNWPGASTFLRWHRDLVRRPENSAHLEVITDQIHKLADSHPRIRKDLMLFVYDLFRGCWAAADFERRGGVAAEIEARNALRADWVARAAKLQDALNLIKSELDIGALVKKRTTDKKRGDLTLCYSFSDSLLRDFQWLESMGHADVGTVNGWLCSLEGLVHSKPINARAAGMGCFRYSDLNPRGAYRKDVPMLLENEDGTWRENPDVVKPPPSARGRNFDTVSLLVFDLVFKCSAWSADALTGHPWLAPSGRYGFPCYSLVAEMVALVFPDSEGVDVEGIARGFRDSGGTWGGWPSVPDDRPSFLTKPQFLSWCVGTLVRRG